MNPATNNLEIYSPITLRLSSLKRRRRCFTGLEPGVMFRACSATSLGMPGMSEGFHANMSIFARRKSTSALSYLGVRDVPTLATLALSLLGSSSTSLAFSTGSKD